jgi:NADPH:quinone reductase-like Zn-dependent oxidoreductase
MSDTGKMKPVVDSVFDFGDVLGVYSRLSSCKAKGKVVIKIDPSTEG